MRPPMRLTVLEDRTAPSAALLKDINLDPQFLRPFVHDGLFYFAQKRPETGWELWKSNGTEAGTELIKDVRKGPADANPNVITAVGAYVYFEIETATGGNELWRTDGTGAGTIRLLTTKSSARTEYGGVGPFAEFRGELYFSIFTGGPSQLWRSNGTVAGTKLVKSIGGRYYDPSIDGVTHTASIKQMAVAGDKLFFNAGTQAFGNELWVSDGTSTGTRQVANIRKDGDSNPFHLTAHGGILYFAATQITSGSVALSTGRELWRSDGTELGTWLVKDIRTGFKKDSSPNHLRSVDGHLYFSAQDDLGVEMWRSDGTESGTVRVTDIVAGAGNSNPKNFVGFGNRVYFLADNGSNGYELWSYNSASGDVALVVDLNPGSDSSRINDLVALNGSLYFTGTDGQSGIEAWRSNGTGAGTTQVADLAPGAESSFPSGFVNIGTEVYCFATTEAHGQALWRTAGGGFEKAVGLPTPYVTLSSNPEGGVNFNGAVYFSATDGLNAGLFKTDGTRAGTNLVRAFPFGINQLTVFAGSLYFCASNGGMGGSLWRSDGTAAGTVQIGPEMAHLFNLTPAAGRLWFNGKQTGGNGLELWTSDGAQNTGQVKDINPGAADGLNYIQQHGTVFAALNGEVYFRAVEPGTGYELWKSDGTEAGTIRLSDILPGAESGFFQWYPWHAAIIGSRLIFWARSSDRTGWSLWQTDGTPGGTTLVKAFTVASPMPLVRLQGAVYFWIDQTLWKSDGSTAGTLAVKQFVAPATLFAPTELAVFDGRLFFPGYSGARGIQLWASDGTPDGTRQFADIGLDRPSQISGLRATDNGLFFSRWRVQGSQIIDLGEWRTDGLAANTRRIANESFGFIGELSGAILFAGGHLDSSRDAELWRYAPITAKPDEYTLEDGVRLDVPANSGVLANDNNGAGQTLTATLVAGPANGYVVLRPDGSFTYQPKSLDFFGDDAFTYFAAAAGDQSDVTTVTIHVDPTNQAPIAKDDAVTGRAGHTVTFYALRNDHDPDHDSLTIDTFTPATNGTVKRTGTALSYTPKIPGALTDHFTYTVKDQRGATAIASVTVTLATAAAPKVTALRLFSGPGAGSVNLVTPGRRVLPFQRLTRIEATFSTDVTVHADDVQLLGLFGPFSLSGFAYDAVRRTASWAVDSPAFGPTDRLTVILDGSTNGVTSPTGLPMGDWTASMNALIGDFDGNNRVTSADEKAVRARFGPVSLARYFADIDGNGVIDDADVALLLANFGCRGI